MNTSPRLARRIAPWIVLWLSAPVSGLIAYLALGATQSPGPAFAGGALIGLGIGAAGAWALDRPFARWMVASSLGLAVGSALAAALDALLPESPLVVLLGAVVAGACLALAQVIVGPPISRPVWFALVTGGWTIAWGVSLALAISAEQGFLIFGSTGSAVFVALLFVVVRRRRQTAVTA